ncbi:uncharacterized protein LOC123545466 [Mercenaria mercenaria]|uniref:uncharacterized protein LOC123545466 n=1 Tax=Mercenaria mercenaria TaxID=6596 RepID=UPI001E1DCB42|nr:uncharacterized protein LOC123545466 [Mercenaria mercenaria]XP_045187723.1 uncharacterized protein LOC123545466 [Mercenaria mercenaria]XP_045187724.1 uncharacterized protein LOC123545466 [Mercenaria mercenaria]
MTSESVDEMASLMAALKALNNTDYQKKKSPGKKKIKKKHGKKHGKKSGATHEEGDEFEYNWPTCACGMNHPPVPAFNPPDGKRCTYYWQIADSFPYMTLHRVLSTEIKFMEADDDQSGLLELDELKTLLKSILGEQNVTDKMVEKTFKEIDQDESGTLDFSEVLGIVDVMIQRGNTNLPSTLQKDYSKVCSIQ